MKLLIVVLCAFFISVAYSEEVNLKLEIINDVEFTGEIVEGRLKGGSSLQELPLEFYINESIFIKLKAGRCTLNECNVWVVFLDQKIEKEYVIKIQNLIYRINVIADRYNYLPSTVESEFKFLKESVDKRRGPKWEYQVAFLIALLLIALGFYFQKRIKSRNKKSEAKVDWDTLNDLEFVNSLSKYKYRIQSQELGDQERQMLEKLIDLSFRKKLTEDEVLLIRNNRSKFKEFLENGI